MREKPKEAKARYKILARNMAVQMIAISFVPLILILLIIGYEFQTSYKEKAIAYLKELVLKHQKTIDLFLNEKLSYLQVLAGSYSYQQLRDEEFLAQKLSVLQSSYSGVFVDIGVVDEKGIQVAYAGAFKLGKADYSHAEWFRQAMGKAYFISDVFLGLRNQPHFIITVKQSTPNEGDWILRATIDFEKFNAFVEQVSVGQTGSAFIINRKGELQTKPNSESPLQKNFLMDLLTEITLSEKTGERPINIGEIQYHNNHFIYVTTLLKNGEWLLVYQQAKSDAFASLYRAQKISLFIFILGALGIVWVVLFIYKRETSYIQHLREQRMAMNEQVIEAGKLASLGELAAGIAHEINNPLAIMLEEGGWIEDLLSEDPFCQCENYDEIKRALKQIRTQGDRCKDITHKLLSVARRTDPMPRKIKLNELIEEIIAISEQRSKFSNIKIIKHLAPNLPEVMASPSEMQQVFLNLLNNSIDAIDAAGGHGGTIEINSRAEGKAVIIDVADTGQGIPGAILSRVFDPFFTTKPVGKGTGLGLSICLGIIKKIGGKLTVNSIVGEGTAFHIHLPLNENEPIEDIRNLSNL
jgi:two-component system, NtrC family, sensor kinase